MKVPEPNSVKRPLTLFPLTVKGLGRAENEKTPPPEVEIIVSEVIKAASTSKQQDLTVQETDLTIADTTGCEK